MYAHLLLFAYLEYFNFGFGVCLNVLLLFCIFRHTHYDLGAYRQLQVLFITVDLLYSSVQIVFQERIITHNTIFCLITIGGGNNQFLLCFYLAFYTMTFVLIDYSFLYRMWAVESPVRVRFFAKPWFISLLSFIAAIEFIILYCNSLFVFNGTEEGREELHEIVMGKYGVDTRSHAMIMGDYIRNGSLHVRSFVGYGIYVTVLSICFGFMIFASIRIIAFLGNHDAMMSTMSGKTKHLQTRLFKMLCWQTLIPFIFLYIPCGASLTLPLLRFNASPLADVTSVLLSFFLPLDALVVLFMMRDYRVAVARMLSCCSRDEVIHVGSLAHSSNAQYSKSVKFFASVRS